MTAPDEPLVIVVTPGPLVGVERLLYDTHEYQAVVLSSEIHDALRHAGHEGFTVEIKKREEKEPR